ncbi:ADP-ribosylglycohydrolase domain-containing protein [Ditylenchus destructor]|uniref:ADP-ribosylhydrolase ARH3 n=1 Tax=Ditylenchus destructor TaxID=166010 RepID=A0AAD4R3X1_9BILA|nr:ADP-ribosylglycohydrolase domain-containing protein [Ditylenchus destructor]
MDTERDISPEEMKRMLGTFYGQAIGDALGARYEFECAEKVKNMMAEDKLKGSDARLPMLGTSRTVSITDDTEMAICLARSLATQKRFDRVDIACSYYFWKGLDSPHIGFATKTALSIPDEDRLSENWRTNLSVDQKERIYSKIRSQVESANKQSLSNGMLMRSSPLAIAFRNVPYESLRNMAHEDCQLTHSNPIVMDATAVYVGAIASLIKGKTKEEVHTEAISRAESDLVRQILSDSKHQAIPVRLSDGSTTNGDRKCIGYFGVALQSAFYELFHADSFDTALEAVIARGGDTDTNGCIAASILGAYFGVDMIPKEWINGVRKAPPSIGGLKMFTLADAEALTRKLAKLS